MAEEEEALPYDYDYYREVEECGPARDDYKARWGLESGCGRTHYQHQIDRNPMTLYDVGWVRLGKDDTPFCCSGWVPDGFDPMTYQARYQIIGWVMGHPFHPTEAPPTIMVKIPGCSVFKVCTDMDWRRAMHWLWVQMMENSGLWCETQPPIVLLCTPEQAERCEARGWIDSVRLELEYSRVGRGSQTSPNVDEGTGKNVAEDAAKGVAEDTAKGVDENAARGVDESAAKGVDENAAKGVDEDAARGVDESAAKGVDENAAKEVEDITKDGQGQEGANCADDTVGVDGKLEKATAASTEDLARRPDDASAVERLLILAEMAIRQRPL